MMGHGTPARVTRQLHRVVLLEPATPLESVPLHRTVQCHRKLSPHLRSGNREVPHEAARVVPLVKRAPLQSRSSQEYPYNLHSHAFGPAIHETCSSCPVSFVTGNVPISPSITPVQEREWIFRHRLVVSRSSRVPTAIRSGFPQSLQTTSRHFHDREPLRRALEQVRGEVSTRHGFIDRVEDPQFFGGIDRLFQPFEA